ncbi:MAG: redox-sensing transcriptional repressor Rex [Chloroflexi bacterium]|nr:redox-sensing transcriptional repressor Rex [Chloroflexota bacterium]MBI3741260.1 redox-sensing transcriptional repressor Rex [Chloroflexota bacterium]
MPQKFVPAIVIARLPLYLRTLGFLAREDKRVTSSQELAERLGLTPAQIRKDLSYFGEFGKQGTGYDIAFLEKQLRQILKIDRVWEVFLVGVGDLGRALAHYRGFQENGFRLIALFDNAPSKIGTSIGAIAIQDVKEMPRVVREKKLQIAILAVPADAAQSVADELVRAGVRAILNYAPVTLNVPPKVKVYSIEPVAGLQGMTYYL